MPKQQNGGVEDCRQAYQWLLDNGPQGLSATVFVAGDSAGSNLTLSLLAWARDTGHRAAMLQCILTGNRFAYAKPQYQR